MAAESRATRAMRISRRQFAGSALAAGAATLGFTGLRRYWNDASNVPPRRGSYGELVPDPEGLLHLPQGFQYRVLSRTGDLMEGGLRVPGSPDGMAAFPRADGKTILIRNHELSATSLEKSAFGKENTGRSTIDPALVYDTLGGWGGTTTLVFDTKNQKVDRQFLSLLGTVRNCAGGPTPWNTWLSCEESVLLADEEHEQDHGFNFEVPASAERLTKATPLKAMGRFNHEAAAVDPNTGIVYQTEDRSDSLFYRFIPNQQGNLASGGRLQALRIVDRAGADTSNQETQSILQRVPMRVDWIELENAEAPEDDLRLQGFEKGAAKFVRGEGIWSEPGSIYFTATSGGFAKHGQVWKFAPQAETLELFAEPNDAFYLEKPDNISIAPWGDLLISEDGPGINRIVGITPEGRYYTLALNALNDSELTGGVFSPDGTTLFLSIQSPGITFAITGPWH
jgi:secreted PhoX family phosphatase